MRWPEKIKTCIYILLLIYILFKTFIIIIFRSTFTLDPQFFHYNDPTLSLTLTLTHSRDYKEASADPTIKGEKVHLSRAASRICRHSGAVRHRQCWRST